MPEAGSSLPTDLLMIMRGELGCFPRFGSSQDELEGLFPLLQGRPSDAFERRELKSVSWGKKGNKHLLGANTTKLNGKRWVPSHQGQAEVLTQPTEDAACWDLNPRSPLRGRRSW